MTPGMWQRAKELFHAALAQSAKERVALLERECGADRELRAEVERMLRDHERSGDFLGTVEASSPATDALVETVATTGSAQTAPAFATEAPGTQIGRYKLQKLLGEGGFGSVWLAEQSEPVRRRVALKIIKLGMDTRHVIARFEAERQALAVMDHPHVAKVFDAGATETGRPYFVMEHVQGLPITEHCDRHKLGLRDRLELFIQVCDAVQHAHQKGIIHRDLKPSNILVEFGDSATPSANPKVIDFGIAKAMTGPLTNMTLYTEQGQLIGTPAYMSPEQADPSAQDIDTRSDIYSLGVLLYELLTGAMPFETSSLRGAGLVEFQRMVREVEPPRPSTRLGTLARSGAADPGDALLPVTPALVAERRRTEVRTLLRTLRGDLDWITMKALEKDRTRRYSSASDFAADIRRHLADEPVLAGPPGHIYRLRKFFRRNRGPALAASLVFALLIAVSVGIFMSLARGTALRLATTMSRDAEDARKVAEQRRADADQAREIELQVSNLLAQTFQVASPLYLGQSARVVDAVARAETILDTVAQNPLVEARLREVIGQLYVEWGDLNKAETHLSRGVEILRRHLPEEHRDRLIAENNLAALLVSRRELKRAEVILVGMLEPLRRTLGEAHEETLNSENNLGNVYLQTGRAAEAEPIYKRSFEVGAAHLGPEHPQVVRSMSNLGRAYRALGRYAEAETLLTRALEIRRRTEGEDHVNTFNSMINLAALYRSQGQFDRAWALFSAALEAQQRRIGPEHPDTLSTLNSLVSLCVAQCWYEQAEPLAARLVVGLRRSQPEALDKVGLALRAHAQALAGLERYEEAEARLLEALEFLMSSATSQEVNSTIAIAVSLYEAWNKPDKAAHWRQWLPQTADRQP